MPSMLAILWGWQDIPEKLIRKLLSFERKLLVVGPGSWETGKRMGIQEEMESGLNFSLSPDSLNLLQGKKHVLFIFIWAAAPCTPPANSLVESLAGGQVIINIRWRTIERLENQAQRMDRSPRGPAVANSHGNSLLRPPLLVPLALCPSGLSMLLPPLWIIFQVMLHLYITPWNSDFQRGIFHPLIGEAKPRSHADVPAYGDGS